MRHVVLVVAASFALVACAPRKGELVLVNDAPEPIARVVVSVCGQTIEGEHIRPGQRLTGTFRVNCEGTYYVTVEFVSGRHVHATTGHVIGGADISSEISIHDTRITLARNTVRQ
jgi:hypothetical protein